VSCRCGRVTFHVRRAWARQQGQGGLLPAARAAHREYLAAADGRHELHAQAPAAQRAARRQAARQQHAAACAAARPRPSGSPRASRSAWRLAGGNWTGGRTGSAVADHPWSSERARCSLAAWPEWSSFPARFPCSDASGRWSLPCRHALRQACPRRTGPMSTLPRRRRAHPRRRRAARRRAPARCWPRARARGRPRAAR